MPESRDCVLVGGGVVGLTLARRLAGEGWSVTLVERSACGTEASWAGAGVLSPLDPRRRDPIFQLSERSLELYPTFCADLLAETGVDPEFERCGELEVLVDQEAVSAARSIARADAHEGESDSSGYEFLSPAQLLNLEPYVTREVLGGLRCRRTAQVRNPRLLRALRGACLNAGVVLRENTIVRSLRTSPQGCIGGVLTDAGELKSATVVLCAGAWSSLLDQRLATLMPVHPVRGQMVLLKLDQRPFRPVVSCGKIYIVPRRDGHVLVGATEEPEAGFQRRNTAQGVSYLLSSALALVPSLASAPVVATWSGLRPGTPDHRPYIGPVPGYRGLFAATGHYRTGLTLAPATAEVISACLTGRPCAINPTCCLPGRA